MSASAAATSSCGRRSWTASTARPSLPSSTTRSSVATGDCPLTPSQRNRSGASRDQQTSPTRTACVTVLSHSNKGVQGWAENDHGVPYTFGSEAVFQLFNMHNLDLDNQVVEDSFEFSEQNLVILFMVTICYGEFDNAAAGMVSVDGVLMCSFQILKPYVKRAKFQYSGLNSGSPVTPPQSPVQRKCVVGGEKQRPREGECNKQRTSSNRN
ncbi:hypothetical protein HPB48_018592 [Haemaphysalis longicornis]|uniref:protein-serine/threonine phosphatase n=1 Tax=Haemaphysalis longicornis TaxID=44386 RepID=A0A9J6FRB7_HAELO|nr:hypothetical protein HPB48_018592 [Haemaphysalis longicornis]